jgi:hypothetical protein
MYEKLDSFMVTDTWHTRHPSDEKRFLVVLHELLKDRDFNPDQMAEHMRGKIGIKEDDHTHPLRPAIYYYTAAAWAVKGYVEANNLKSGI